MKTIQIIKTAKVDCDHPKIVPFYLLEAEVVIENDEQLQRIVDHLKLSENNYFTYSINETQRN